MIKLRLERRIINDKGAFGSIVDEVRDQLAFTLEHAYICSPGEWQPNVPPGTYLCKRGIHQLKQWEAIRDVRRQYGIPGHTGILFHTGNTDQDSEGCILLGVMAYEDRLFNSKVAFERFMRFLSNVTEFNFGGCMKSLYSLGCGINGMWAICLESRTRSYDADF